MVGQQQAVELPDWAARFNITEDCLGKTYRTFSGMKGPLVKLATIQGEPHFVLRTGVASGGPVEQSFPLKDIKGS